MFGMGIMFIFNDFGEVVKYLKFVFIGVVG